MELDDLTTILYVLALILMCGYVVFYTIRKLVLWKNSSLVEAKIIGYKWKGQSYWKRTLSNSTGFDPVLKYQVDGQEIVAPIENVGILLPERDIKIRIYDDYTRHVQLDFLFGIVGISIFLFIISMIYADINANYGFYGFISLIPITVSIYLWDDYRNLGTFQNSLNYIQPRKTVAHIKINEEFLRTVETAKLVTYEQAMAHYNYYANHHFRK